MCLDKSLEGNGGPSGDVPLLYEGQHRLALWHRSGLSAIRATAAGDGLYDLDLFAGTGVLDKVTDVDDALVAGVGALEAGVMRLCGVVMILSRWVRGCARLSGVHSVFSLSVGQSRGVREHSPGSIISC